MVPTAVICICMSVIKKRNKVALAGVSQFGSHMANQKVVVRFLVRAHAWVVGSVPGGGVCRKQPTDVSL